MNNRIYSLLFVGVGGQGALLAAEITALTAARVGYDVKQTEVHGVSQRGGSVETHLRFGPQVHSPVVTPGQVDALVALEKLEALRFAHFVNRESGVILLNDLELMPGSVANAESLYPHNVQPYLQEHGYRVQVAPATAIARELGDARMANTVMLGALAAYLPFSLQDWQATLETRIPLKYRAANLAAFAAGSGTMTAP